MSDELVEEAIINKFQIEELDWRKLDIDLNTLTRSPHADQFTKLTLYASGNWSVLYHWVLSKDGIAKLPNVKEVKIGIIHLNHSDGVHDRKARDRHKILAEEYKDLLETGLQKLKEEELELLETGHREPKLNFRYSLFVNHEAKWEFPVLKYQQDNELYVPKLQFVDQLVPCHNHLSNLVDEDDPIVQRFKAVTSVSTSVDKDRRIKVAIIDNGVDRFQESIKDKIAKGISYVTADSGRSGRMLPWWLVADPHGTQMASLVAQANPYCRLYIARVGKGRKDILTEHAVKAIKWAVEQGVDIISISWTTRKHDSNLEKAIEEAVNPRTGRRTLVFCSVADEGNFSGAVFPVQWHPKHILSVAATDTYGHLTPAADRAGGNVSIQVPGMDVMADGPSYHDAEDKTSDDGTVSGSSAATALAAGIASLALIMLQTYNVLQDHTLDEFHGKAGMQKVFNKMHAQEMGIQLPELFPGDRVTNEKLKSLWSLDNINKSK